MSLFRDVFNYETPEQMLQTLHGLETVDNYNQTTSFIDDDFTDFRDKFKAMSEGNEKSEGTKILTIVDKILDFALKERKQRR